MQGELYHVADDPEGNRIKTLKDFVCWKDTKMQGLTSFQTVFKIDIRWDNQPATPSSRREINLWFVEDPKK